MKPVGVLLAAGNSSRFGSNKLAYPLGTGETLGLSSAHKLISLLDECIAVVRKTDTQFRSDLEQLGFSTVIQPDPDAGMGNSLARAVQASPGADGWLISLADMPWITSETLNLMVTGLQKGAPIIAPVFEGQRGHPVGFSKNFLEELIALDGDVGARSLLSAHAELIQLVNVNDPGIVKDVDTLEDLMQ